MKTAANGTGIFWKSFQKFRKLLNFRNANHSTENVRNSGSKVEWKENLREKFFRKFEYTSRGCPLFLEMSENRHYRCSQPKNVVPFATGSCRKFKPEVLVEWKAPLVFLLAVFQPLPPPRLLTPREQNRQLRRLLKRWTSIPLPHMTLAAKGLLFASLQVKMFFSKSSTNSEQTN